MLLPNEDDSSRVTKRDLLEDASCPTPSNPEIARFQLETITGISWELAQGLFEYVAKPMTHHVSDRVLKDKVFASPCPHNMKGTPILDGYIKELLLENIKNFNHEDALKSN